MKTLADDIFECDAFINPDQLTQTCKCIIFGYDKGLGRNILQTAYYDSDVKKFYMKNDCLVENDLESYWRITVKKCAYLEPVTFDREATIERQKIIEEREETRNL